ncbi:MAG: hypothetical protein GEV10_24145 [Streptosporangiales bacterium]|nr:hypothetical protein [Streptosporangiales bacterium]
MRSRRWTAGGHPAGRSEWEGRDAARRRGGAGGGARLRPHGDDHTLAADGPAGAGVTDGLVRATAGTGYVHLELHEPARRNPLSDAMLAALREALVRVDPGVNTVIVSGAGEAFSAGADLTELTGTVADLGVDEAIAETLALLRRTPALTVAAVDGPCMGGAVDLAVSCDLVVAGETSAFAVPATRLGILYNPAAVAHWHRRLPRQTLVRLLLAGDRLDARQAYDGGLVGQLVPAGRAVATATALAERQAGASPAVVAAVKGLLVDLDEGDVDLSRWHEVRERLLAAPDRVAALRAVRERR